MASVRISKAIRDNIVNLVIKDSVFAEAPKYTAQISEKVFTEFLYDIAGGKEKYMNLELITNKYLTELRSEVPEVFLSYNLQRSFTGQRVNKVVGSSLSCTISLQKRNVFTGYQQREGSVSAVMQRTESLPFVPASICLEEQSVDVREKWMPIFELEITKFKEYRDNRGKLISSLNNLLDENNTTNKLKKNCPDLVKYFNAATEMKAGVSIESAGNVTDKSDLKVVMSALR